MVMNLKTAMKKFEVSTKNGKPFLRFKGRVVKGGEKAKKRKTTAASKTKTGQATSWKRLAEKANRLGVNVVTKKLPVTAIPRSYRKTRTQLITGILNKKNELPVWKPGKPGRPKMTNEERAASRAFSRRKQKGQRKLQKLGKNFAARKIQRAYRAKKAKKQTPNQFVNSLIVNAKEATKKRKAAEAELVNARVEEKNAQKLVKVAKANARNNAPVALRRSTRTRRQARR
jgi:hypothetical protein